MIGELLATSLLVSSTLAHPTDTSPQPNTTSVEWSPCDLDFDIYTKERIAEHGETLFCANLTVPLDYTEPENGKTIDLQLLKVKANKEPFKGSILTNPGGPGGSGVDWIATEGPEYRDQLGGFHDIIGFDPRGTGRTIPFTCDISNNSTSKVKRGEYNYTIPQSDAYGELVERFFEDGRIFAEACANTPGNADIAPYIGTVFVARDMLSMIDALGEEKLQYWGISYGTFLGQTFAGLFPDRIGRVVLDSAFEFDDYHSGQWNSGIRDTERAVVNALKECVDAGPVLCPIANFTGPDTTAETLHQEIGKAFQELIDNPVPLPDDYAPRRWFQPGGFDLYILVKSFAFTLAYQPELLGSLWTSAEYVLNRDWDTIVESLTLVPNITIPMWSQGVDAFHGIACGDGAFRADKPEDMYSWTQAQLASGSFGDALAQQVWPCAQWKFEAKERYTGPFNAINTSYPILFVNGNHDPITPLSAAYEASANFPGSRLVVQNGHGHGILSHPSACTIKTIADYFNEGTLPEVGRVCQTDKPAYEVYADYIKELASDTNSTNSALTKRASVIPRIFT